MINNFNEVLKEKELTCIFGGEKSPTPFGVFQVEM